MKNKESLNNFIMEKILKTYFNSTRINLLLYGKPGVGKSSLINSFASTLEGKYVQKAASAALQESFTKEMKRYSINKKGTINIVDIFGAVGDNLNALLSQILNGEIRDGFREGDTLNYANLIAKPTINDKIHLIIFVVDSIDLNKKSIMKEYKEKIVEVQKLGKSLLFTKTI